MPRFLAIYVGTATARAKSDWNSLPETERQWREAEGMRAWGEWATQVGAAIVDGGSPLGRTKRVSPEGVADTTNTSVGYVIVEAPTHDAAARLFENHPHFSRFPGDSVEVMECLPLPR